MKKYILKLNVYNHIDFPLGTIVKITDDYFGAGGDKNTGFTVLEGKLAGEKGCVADGLEGYLLEDTPENRKLVQNFKKKSRKLAVASEKLNTDYDNIPIAILT